MPAKHVDPMLVLSTPIAAEIPMGIEQASDRNGWVSNDGMLTPEAE